MCGLVDLVRLRFIVHSFACSPLWESPARQCLDMSNAVLVTTCPVIAACWPATLQLVSCACQLDCKT